MNKEFKYSLSQINDIIPAIWSIIKDYRIIALRGALGAGKTTFTRALTAFLKTNEKATSPTFSLINEYSFKDEYGNPKTIFHSDWYRLKNEEEAIDAGIEDMLQQHTAICIIEWPEKAEKILPEDAINIQFEIEGEEQRKIIISRKITAS